MAFRSTLAFLLSLSSVTATSAFVHGSQCPAAGTPNKCVRGMAIKNVEAKTADECCQLCASFSSGCAAWQFDHLANYSFLQRPPCHLKPSAAHIVSCNTSISGIVIPVPPGPGPAPPGPSPSPAPLSFATVFTSSKDGNAAPVLQMNAHVSIFGSASKGEQDLDVYLDGVLVAHTSVNPKPSSPERAWIAVLPPQPASSTLRTLTVGNGHFNATLKVRFGVVVLCSGQSNMGMTVGYGAPHTFPAPGQPGSHRRSFSADNGTAETASAGRYTGKIFLYKQTQQDESLTYNRLDVPMPSDIWIDVTNRTLGGFSAACWYSGKSLYEAELKESETPLGLFEAAVGGSPIEYWVPSLDPSDVNKFPCYEDRPQCDTSGGKNDTLFYRTMIAHLVPYTLGAVVWDQAERDVKCPKSLHNYACMQRYLIHSWRSAFNSSFVFVAVQLAGYTAAIKNGTGSYPGYIPSEWVWRMRLQQDAGCVNSTVRAVTGCEDAGCVNSTVRAVTGCAVVPTYDVSCQAGIDGGCPYGSVHQPHKSEIGGRVGGVLAQLLRAKPIEQGPRVTTVTLISTRSSSLGLVHTLEAMFQGGKAPYALADTRNCTTLPGYCCDGSANNGHTLDLDASHDGLTFVNATNTTLDVERGSLMFDVVGLPATPKIVRHTAASIWPQCALVGADGLPAHPFQITVQSEQ